MIYDITENVVLYNDQRSLVGVLTAPVKTEDDHLPAVIMLNCGLIHRVGPNRLYVKVARALASMGFTVLRLDLAGIGDSASRAENLPLEQSVLADVRDAMDMLTGIYGKSRFVMMGHCAGGMSSLLMVEQEPRVVGAILLNLLGGDGWTDLDRQRKESTYYANFYGRGALANGSRWRKVLTGKADYCTIFNNIFKFVILNFVSILFFRLRAALGLHALARNGNGAQTDTAASQQARLCAVLNKAYEQSVQFLFIHDAGSTGLEFFRTLAAKELNQLFAADMAREVVIPESDHLFTLLVSQQHVINVIQTWVEEQVMQTNEGSGLSVGLATTSGRA